MSFQVGLDHLVQKDIYAQYLRRLDARAVLEHYGAQNCTEQPGGDGTVEIVHSCLLDRVEPHHTNGDAHPSASCNIDKKVYVCYALGWGGDLFHLIQKMEDTDALGDTLSTVGQFLTGATSTESSIREEIDKLFASRLYAVDLPVYSERVLDAWSWPHPYWAERGINDAAINMLHLGFDPTENRIVFPHFVDDKLVGWQKRVIPAMDTRVVPPKPFPWSGTSPEFPKYRNSSGFPKSETLYNFDLARRHPRVCVVESPMSVARAVSLGLPNVVATFGAKVSTFQIDLLKRFDAVYVWFDRDGAGITGERKLTEGLYRHTDVRVITPDKDADMGDADLGIIATKLKQATPAALKLGASDNLRRMR